MGKITKVIDKLFKHRDILRDDSAIYMRRYYILNTPWFRLRLHHIFLSDYDCLHDHPWNFLSILLKGEYIERRGVGVYEIDKIYKAGDILYRRAEDRHRLIINKPVWSLVFMFKRRREWGFWTKQGWLPWFKYQSQQKCD
jgi:hypothetical protein